MTIRDLLTLWDTGQPVGLPRIAGDGPSWDQGAYILALELVRAVNGGAGPLERIEVRTLAALGSLRLRLGQVAQGRWVAQTVLRLGPDAAAGANPAIVCRAFPVAPKPKVCRADAGGYIGEGQAAAQDAKGAGAELPGPLGTDFPRRVRTTKVPG